MLPYFSNTAIPFTYLGQAKANFNNLLDTGLEYNVTDASLQMLQDFVDQSSVNMF